MVDGKRVSERTARRRKAEKRAGIEQPAKPVPLFEQDKALRAETAARQKPHPFAGESPATFKRRCKGPSRATFFRRRKAKREREAAVERGSAARQDLVYFGSSGPALDANETRFGRMGCESKMRLLLAAFPESESTPIEEARPLDDREIASSELSAVQAVGGLSVIFPAVRSVEVLTEPSNDALGTEVEHSANRDAGEVDGVTGLEVPFGTPLESRRDRADDQTARPGVFDG